MASKQEAKQYMNQFARALSMVDLFPSCYSEIYALPNFQTKFENISNQLNRMNVDDTVAFLNSLEDILSTTEKQDRFTKIINSLAICLFLDRKLSYEADAEGAFSIYHLVLLKNNKAVILDVPLNSNCEETGIWISPKFSACSLYEHNATQQKERRLFNRDSFVGLNGELKNCSFMRWNESLSVVNVIVSAEFLSEHRTQRLRVGFSPLSDNIDLLDTDPIPINRDGIDYSGEQLTKIKSPDLIMERFRCSWQLACDNNADIFFAPEMLCTDNMFESDDERNLFLQEMATERLLRGENIPTISILPSYWHQGTNSCQITYQAGQILGEQTKRFPYVNRTDGTLEAIKFQKNNKIILVHIPGVHRIAVMICADFLTQQEEWLEKYVCGQLQATLIIVPSYSAGEQDFINSLPIVKRYGASVIWGNCCGAKDKGGKQIGGCGIVGSDSISRFGNVCTCQSSCQGTAGCVFIVDIPLKLIGDTERDKVLVLHETKTDKLHQEPLV